MESTGHAVTRSVPHPGVFRGHRERGSGYSNGGRSGIREQPTAASPRHRRARGWRLRNRRGDRCRDRDGSFQVGTTLKLLQRITRDWQCCHRMAARDRRADSAALPRTAAATGSLHTAFMCASPSHLVTTVNDRNDKASVAQNREAGCSVGAGERSQDTNHESECDTPNARIRVRGRTDGSRLRIMCAIEAIRFARLVDTFVTNELRGT
jgi:hypothetical protein